MLITVGTSYFYYFLGKRKKKFIEKISATTNTDPHVRGLETVDFVTGANIVLRFPQKLHLNTDTYRKLESDLFRMIKLLRGTYYPSKEITLDLEKTDYLNSSAITALIRILAEIKANNNCSLKIVINTDTNNIMKTLYEQLCAFAGNSTCVQIKDIGGSV